MLRLQHPNYHHPIGLRVSMNGVRLQRAVWKFIGMAAKIILILETMVAVLWLTTHSNPNYNEALTIYLVIAAPCVVALILSRIFTRKLTRKLATIYFN